MTVPFAALDSHVRTMLEADEAKVLGEVSGGLVHPETQEMLLMDRVQVESVSPS